MVCQDHVESLRHSTQLKGESILAITTAFYRIIRLTIWTARYQVGIIAMVEVRAGFVPEFTRLRDVEAGRSELGFARALRVFEELAPRRLLVLPPLRAALPFLELPAPGQREDPGL